VEGTSGLFVAMPSRKLSLACSRCSHKNHMRAKFCNECGAKLSVHGIPPDADGRTRLHRDIAHPITAAFREAIQQRIIEAYHTERERADDTEYTPQAEDDMENEVPEDASSETPREKDDYSALIADLKGGPAASGRGGGKHGGREPKGPGGDREADRTSDSRPKRRQRGRRRGREEAEERREEPTPAVPEGETERGPEPEPAVPEPDEERHEEVPTATDEPSSDDAVRLEESAGESATSEDKSEDTAGFGAGLF
jgi:stage V sporulation protein G